MTRTYEQRMFLALQRLIQSGRAWGQHPNADRIYAQQWRVISCINADMWKYAR